MRTGLDVSDVTFVGGAKAYVFRCVETPSKRDYVALATMLSEGSFDYAVLVHFREAAAISDTIETWWIRDIEHLVTRFAQLRGIGMAAPLDLARFFAGEAPKLRRYLRRFEPWVSSEDIAQDAFARLCALDPGKMNSPRALLYHTARNLAVDQIRRHKRAPIRSASESVIAAAPDSSASSAEEALVQREETSLITAALEQLPEKQRMALVLRKVEGLSPDVIATRLGVSERQVQRLIIQAMTSSRAFVRASDDSKSDQR